MDTVFSSKSFENQDAFEYFGKGPEWDHFRDRISLQWENGEPDFDPFRLL